MLLGSSDFLGTDFIDLSHSPHVANGLLQVVNSFISKNFKKYDVFRKKIGISKLIYAFSAKKNCLKRHSAEYKKLLKT